MSNHSVLINLMSVSLKSFEVVLSIYRLGSDRVDMSCDEKAIFLNLPSDQTFMIHGDKPNFNLRITSCIKAQKLPRKESYVFIAHVISAKQEVKDLESVPEDYNFS